MHIYPTMRYIVHVFNDIMIFSKNAEDDAPADAANEGDLVTLAYTSLIPTSRMSFG